MPGLLPGRRVLITGASSGTGAGKDAIEVTTVAPGLEYAVMSIRQ